MTKSRFKAGASLLPSPGLPAENNAQHSFIAVGRSGDWMPAEELRDAALEALGADIDVTLNLDGVDHLDASGLQILLALDHEQKKRGRNLQLTKISPGLSQWFALAGASDRLSILERKNDE